MSLEQGILGYLSFKPLSGYDLKKLFNMSAAFFWPADQAQIYRSLKKLTNDGLIELIECSKGETVDRKAYTITDKGRGILKESVMNNSKEDFISRNSFLVQLFFSGTLNVDEQLQFIETQLENNNALIQQLKDNFEENSEKFIKMAGLSENDRRFCSAFYVHRWGLIRCEAYSQLLEEIKAELSN